MFSDPTRSSDLLPFWGEDPNQEYLKFGGERERKNCDSRKDAKTPSSENPKFIFNFAPWRLGGRQILEVILSNILRVRI
jgi:hypothetical protein